MEAQRHIESAQEEALSLDLRRTLVLGRYLQAWSMPEYRIVMTGRQGRARIEIYFFRRPPAASPRPLRDRGAIPPSPRERSGSRRMDDGAGRRPGRGKRGPGVRISVRPDRPQHREHGRRRTAARDGASPLAPEKWTAKAILIDELRGESEALERIAVGSETVELQWVVPISQKEAALILDQGSMRSTRMSRAWRIPSSIPRGRNRPLNRPRADTRCTP